MGNIKKVPLRKCIGCNEMKNKKEMMRVLKTPEGEITLDVTGERTAAAHMFVFRRNVCTKPSRTKGWNVP